MSVSKVAPYYRSQQIQELKRKLGITLDSVEGLISEVEISRLLGVATIANYRKRGLIVPVGYVLVGGGKGLSAYYERRQLDELKAALGITLESTDGLMTSDEFAKATGLTVTTLSRYRKENIFTPYGYALNRSGVGAYYHPDQVDELLQQIGVTLRNTDGLISEIELGEKLGRSMGSMIEARKSGKIKAEGFAFAGGPKPTAFYTPEQADEAEATLGKKDAIAGLLTALEFAKEVGWSKAHQVHKHIKNGTLVPAAYGPSNAGQSPFFRKSQVPAFKKQLGITIDSVEGLLDETAFAKAVGVSQRMVWDRRQAGQLTPIGFGLGPYGIGPFYHPDQIDELRDDIKNRAKNSR
jgi:transcriptional regulator with XRE-family HTH domain